jgi:flagellar motor switch protein FliN
MPSSAPLFDIELPLAVRFAGKSVLLGDLTRIAEGGALEFNRAVTDPVELLVEGRLIARGEVVVSHNNLCVRITEMVDTCRQ